MSSCVSRPSPASSEEAQTHFEYLLRLETDCWDVHHAISHNRQDFLLLDVRSAECFAKAHVPRAINLPHTRINETHLSQYPTDTLFVVYCAGAHCNGADKAALKLAKLNRPVKKMMGGMVGWKAEGFKFEKIKAKTFLELIC